MDKDNTTTEERNAQQRVIEFSLVMALADRLSIDPEDVEMYHRLQRMIQVQLHPQFA